MNARWKSIRDRKLVQWGTAYLAGAWLLLQIGDLATDRFDLPATAFRVLTILLALGFPSALILAWYHGERGEQRVTSMEISMLAGILVIAGAAVLFVGGGIHGTAEPRAPSATAAVPAERSIAVLPFLNLSADPAQEYFTDGLAEELLNGLAQNRELRVAARTSSFAFKGKGVPISEIARQLNVRYVLEGSVRKSGDYIRITAQLIDARSGYHLWSRDFDRRLVDVFAVQDEISAAIVKALRVTLEGEPHAGVATRSSEAHDLYLRGRSHVAQRGESDLRQASVLFEEALSRDPQYAPAYAGLASVWALLPLYAPSVPAKEGARRGKEAARQALTFDSANGEAYAALGQIAEELEWNWPEAERNYRRALELQPNNATAHQWLGELLMSRRRTAEALEELRMAVDLDPLSAVISANYGLTLLSAGRYDAAIAQMRRTVELDPRFELIYVPLVTTYLMVGQYANARAFALRLRASGFRDADVLLAVVDGAADPRRRAAALHALQGAEAAGRLMPAQGLASAYAVLRDGDGAIRVLRRGIEKHQVPSLHYFLADPVFDFLHEDPRYQALVRAMNRSIPGG